MASAGTFSLFRGSTSVYTHRMKGPFPAALDPTRNPANSLSAQSADLVNNTRCGEVQGPSVAQ